jgi:hypothetical protein
MFYEQQLDGKSFVANPDKEQSGQTDAKITIHFNIYETNVTGCILNQIAWALNITKVVF